jgi:hypothetical protein
VRKPPPTAASADINPIPIPVAINPWMVVGVCLVFGFKFKKNCTATSAMKNEKITQYVKSC